MADNDQTVTIDGKDYQLDQLSEEARKQLANLRLCDEEIARIQRQYGIAQAARVTYSNLLERELPGEKSTAKPSTKSTARNGAAKKTTASRSKKSTE
ncbi:hypothetical protein KGQ96_06025 [Halomonas coralii]|uniref:DUF6447 family protein n=1 Tax=Modicisalibacter sp. R2A 31.J TaxID=2831898 RepID=UPI001CC93F19|nr:DUF6447 family protein [Modicisalibacter sp. R2A 31.J]MBZ9557617.1 hypothetical protein [Modicisalibacter sp. R2A 31.J]